MVQIKSEYEKIAKRTLYDHIQTDTNGNYRRVLLELLRQRLEATPLKPSTDVREVLDRQLSQRFTNGAQRSVRFDRDNQAKSNTLSRLNSQGSSIDLSSSRQTNDH